jgi:flotillin
MSVVFLFWGLLGSALGFNFAFQRFYFICQPSEVLIFAGTSSQNGTKGYRLVKGGSAIRLPLLEKKYQMELTNMIIDLQVKDAYSKGGIPLTVEGVANIKIAGTVPTIYNAVERLLGKSRKEIEKMAKETLEGNLRGVLASLTPEQANGDQIAFAKTLLEEAEADLETLGLILDSLQIQRITDDVSYLDSIGRKQQAELIQDARIAEATNRADSLIQAAVNERETALRQMKRDEEIAKIEASMRVRDAETKRVAMVAEVESVAGAQIVKAEAEVNVYQELIKQVELQLQAEIVIPAQADCEEAYAMAKAEAAKIIETGKSQTYGTMKLAESWKGAGESAREIFLLQKLDTLLKLIGDSVPEVEIQNIRVINAQGENTPLKVANFLDQLKETSGIDVKNLLAMGRSPH